MMYSETLEKSKRGAGAESEKEVLVSVMEPSGTWCSTRGPTSHQLEVAIVPCGFSITFLGMKAREKDGLDHGDKAV